MANWNLTFTFLIIGFVNLSRGVHCQHEHAVSESLVARVTAQQEEPAVDCLLRKDVLRCLSGRLGRDLDQIESEITPKSNGPPISTAIEESARFLAELVYDVQEPQSLLNGFPQDQSTTINESPRALEEEARKKKFGKKKKKHLQKLLGVAMLLKAKIGLLLQLISTHFQLKFFVLALVNLVLNAAKFWFDLKKSHPSKVIYYEHAQHQHHYDHDDHDHSGYWARSANTSPEDLAYNAYKPTDQS